MNTRLQKIPPAGSCVFLHSDLKMRDHNEFSVIDPVGAFAEMRITEVGNFCFGSKLYGLLNDNDINNFSLIATNPNKLKQGGLLKTSRGINNVYGRYIDSGTILRFYRAKDNILSFTYGPCNDSITILSSRILAGYRLLVIDQPQEYHISFDFKGDLNELQTYIKNGNFDINMFSHESSRA